MAGNTRPFAHVLRRAYSYSYSNRCWPRAVSSTVRVSSTSTALRAEYEFEYEQGRFGVGVGIAIGIMPHLYFPSRIPDEEEPRGIRLHGRKRDRR